MKFRSALLFSLLMITGAAHADYPHLLNTGVLRADCELLDRSSQVRCEAFLMGVADAVNAIKFSGKSGEKYFCAPERTNEIHLRQAFVVYVSNRLPDNSTPAADVALAAFAEAFPCE